MFPLWDSCIAPVLNAADVRKVVEIGALRGETTVQMLERLGPDVELHVIDPVPEFDPTEHEEQFPGRYVFHRDISHNVLPEMGPVDAALIDGDHNWYTVYHELKMLSDVAREAGEPLPVLIMHDVLWPYGRRDLYYTPELIPEEHRQPFAQRGMGLQARKLLPPGRGGLSPKMNNAVMEGGPRNGVMTALDDFMEEYDRPLRRMVIPIYFGLAIVVEEERLERQPELAAVLDGLQSPETLENLLALCEQLRLKALVFQHSTFYNNQDQIEKAALRYLRLLKRSLLDEHYIDNELRLGYLAQCLGTDKEPDPQKLRDPSRHLVKESRRLRDQRTAGTFGAGPPDRPAFFPYTDMGHTRIDHLESCLDTIRQESVDGDLVECGTGRGGGAIFQRGYLDAYQMLGRQVWVADPFRAERGTPEDLDVATTGSYGFGADLNAVREGFDRFELLDDRVRFLQGPPEDTLPDASVEKIALLRVGLSDAVTAGPALDALYDRITLGGFVIVDGYDTADGSRQVDRFRSDRDIPDPLERIDAAAVGWRKLEHAPASPAVPTARSDRPPRAPLAPPTPTDSTDLSVVVVFYNMQREAARTLHSLSRSYQREIDDLDYDVIVVENGSDEDQRLGSEYVTGFGPEFRYLDLGGQATPSPANALNEGLALARGKTIALMIDGAHVLTPRVLHFAMAGLKTYEPAMVVTQQWYVGPGQQGDVMLSGYDQKQEDRLFETISWPTDGYRLFNIGHFIGDRDWFDGVWESNCVFIPRRLLEQAGAMDESFDMPGGGYANLDFYERLGATPGLTVVSLLGEGSFHQVHGGTTTNQSDMVEKANRLASYGEHYTELRGKGFTGPRKPIHYIGSLPESARRTRARRMVAPTFYKSRDPEGPDGIPADPAPVPQDFRAECIDAYWRSLAWQKTTWLGASVTKCPTDLFAYQELLAAVRPDWIVETGRGGGRRALFLASVCDLLDHGHVLSVDETGDSDGLPRHERVSWIDSHPLSPRSMRSIRDLVGEDPHALVILGSQGTKHRTVTEFATFSPLVPVGSYVIVEDTVLNGNPVWPGFGLGPAEAVREIINTRRDQFAPDPAIDKNLLSFNPGGFLKRMA